VYKTGRIKKAQLVGRKRHGRQRNPEKQQRSRQRRPHSGSNKKEREIGRRGKSGGGGKAGRRGALAD